ncbi:galactokinase-like [Sitodiplosis mosellana]|uniref:galactokinase-like n=1 Tax=Sitodiplosis mosellana TaxID=263140 RepID=UPI0024452A76|nr:galactokinase-like [Sitodiplosis mosellana]XP_055325082.1 galactokinase-like [Sitodiplosis mosellana]
MSSESGSTAMANVMLTDPVPAFDTIYEDAIKTFRDTFDAQPDVAVCAPGRVNLIGEHIDYNDGFVLPMALPMVTIIVGKRNQTKSTANVVTCCDGADDPTTVSFDLNNLTVGTPKWANYIKGVLKCFGKQLPGFDAVILTNVPIGGGLSSSAALEVATLTFIQALTEADNDKNPENTKSLTQKQQALLCQKAEHEFAGMPCGVMDQLISVCGKRDHALLIDCQTLDIFQIPFEMGDDLAVLICNSNVRHELSHSEYPTRRNQCAQALELLRLNSYKDATIKSLDALKGSDEVFTRRARHVITEIQRTREAAEALRKKDFIEMGRLMNESHESLRDDFEVSCAELDILVEAAISCSASVLGSRMTGGGFGGCTVTLLRKSDINNVITHIKTIYSANGTNGRTASFYVVQPGDGTRRIM